MPGMPHMSRAFCFAAGSQCQSNCLYMSTLSPQLRTNREVWKISL